MRPDYEARPLSSPAGHAARCDPSTPAQTLPIPEPGLAPAHPADLTATQPDAVMAEGLGTSGVPPPGTSGVPPSGTSGVPPTSGTGDSGSPASDTTHGQQPHTAPIASDASPGCLKPRPRKAATPPSERPHARLHNAKLQPSDGDSFVFDSKLGATRVRVLVDSGASDSFVAEQLVRRYQLTARPTASPMRLELGDGHGTPVTQEVRGHLRLGRHCDPGLPLLVAPLADHFDVVLGRSWLKLHNPHIDWVEETICFPHPDGPIIVSSAANNSHPFLLSAMSLSRAFTKCEVEECWLVSLKLSSPEASTPPSQEGGGEAAADGQPPAASEQPPPSADRQAREKRYAALADQILEQFAEVMQEDLPAGVHTDSTVKHRIETIPGTEPPCKR